MSSTNNSKDEELIAEIKWVMLNYGWDADEIENPGSKLQAQAERIAEFVSQRSEAWDVLSQHGLDLLKPVSKL